MDRMQLEQAKITLRGWANLVQDQDALGDVALAAIPVLAALERLELRWDAVLELADRWQAAAARMRARYESLGAVSTVAHELERCAAELRALGEPTGTTIPPTEPHHGDE